MRTEAQIEASRANGRRSRGPVTEEGKAISSRNAVTHGLLSNTAVLPGEDPVEFDRILAAILDIYQPQNEEEMQLVEEYVFFKWRQLRLWSLNTAAIAGELANQAVDNPELLQRDLAYRTYEIFKNAQLAGLTFPLMHRYEVSFGSQYHRARRELRKVLTSKDTREKVEHCCSFPNEPKESK